MKIYDFLPLTLIDWPGKLAFEVFTPGCNFRCGACHSKMIVDDVAKRRKTELEVFSSIGPWIDGFIICGGEPTLQQDLLEFVKREKEEKGLPIKLDTNGSNPKVLRDLLREDLVDYVALDIKAPYYLYPKVVGRDVDMDRIEESIKLTTKFPDYEFRTTIVPVLRNEEKGEFSWMTVQEGKSMARWVSEYVGRESKWYLQKFVPRERELIDERLENWQETPQQLLEEMLGIVKGYFPNVQIRGEN